MPEPDELRLGDNSVSDATQGGEAAYFPLRFIVDFLKFLIKNQKTISLITYDDLAWGDDYNFERNYAEEKQRWLKWRASGDIDPNKIYVLLQHDVDTRPERTIALLRHEQALGVPSNVMIFSRRIARRVLRDQGRLEYTPYEIETGFLQQLQGQGFVIGYHSNAHEQSLFDIDKAQNIFANDVEALSQIFDIKYFSAHGGAPGPDGKNNRDIPLPSKFRKLRKY